MSGAAQSSTPTKFATPEQYAFFVEAIRSIRSHVNLQYAGLEANMPGGSSLVVTALMHVAAEMTAKCPASARVETVEYLQNYFMKATQEIGEEWDRQLAQSRR